jgi:hypothetical protein
MSEESTTPDLVELTAQAFEAGSRHDLDVVMAVYPDIDEARAAAERLAEERG